MLKQNSHLLLSIIVIFDLIFLFFSYIGAKFIANKMIDFSLFKVNEIVIISIIIVILFIILERFEYSHNYRFKTFFRILKDIVSFEFTILAFFYLPTLFNLNLYSNTTMKYFIFFTATILFFERMGIKLILTIIRRQGFNYRRYIVIGAGSLGLKFYRQIISRKDIGIKIIGFLDDNETLIETNDPDYTDLIKKLILGSTDKIANILHTQSIDNVIIALPMYAYEKIIDITNICEKNGVKAELLPDYFRLTTSNPSVREVEGIPLIGIRKVPLENMFNRFIKRIIDIFFSVGGLIFLSPLLLLIIILIKITSRGPIFFKQERTGYNQKEFNIIKFRTMKLNKLSDTLQATKDDPRMTKIGSYLRKYNLDELPQLVNILKGEMSLIGPRPHMLAHTEEFYKKYDKYLVRHWVKPGLSGWAQVNGWRGDSDIGVRIKYDIAYIENWSIWLDLKILFLTIFGKKVKRNAV